MASPHVAGAAALYAANSPGATPAQVKSALQNAGSTDWSDADDPDSTQERLLDAGTF
jgi:subtilisin family serine protease